MNFLLNRIYKYINNNYSMNFIKHIFSGSLLWFTLVFNPMFLFFFYQAIFVPDAFYEGMLGYGVIIAIGIYSTYWAYCIKTFKEQNT